MRVIFLDFDGVLNCSRFFHHMAEFTDLDVNPPRPEWGKATKEDAETWRHMLDPTLISNLSWIIKACGRKGDPIMIAYTTSWKDYFSKSLMASLLEPIIPRSHSYGVVKKAKFSSERGHDIGFWLRDHPEVTKFAVIDDHNMANTLHGENFFQTDGRDGLTMKMAHDIARHLGIGDTRMPTILL
jgi:hypothetical protein